MSKEKSIVIKIKLKNALGQKCKGLVNIMDGVALSVFTDKKLAKELYDAEKNSGNKNVFYDNNSNAFIQQYKGKKKEEISEILQKELKKIKGEVIK